MAKSVKKAKEAAAAFMADSRRAAKGVVREAITELEQALLVLQEDDGDGVVQTLRGASAKLESFASKIEKMERATDG